MSFARPDLVWLAPVFAALVFLASVAYARRRARVARALGDPALVRRLGLTEAGSFPGRRALTLSAAAALLGFAAAGPQWGVHEVEGRGAGRDVVIVVDVSRSMLVQDVAPDRLERQRLLARQLVRELEGSRIGLVAFAGRAHILTPLTTDRGALELFLDAIDAEIASQGGSSLATAIRQGTDLARQGYEQRGGQRTVILISDGESHEDQRAVMEAANRAARAGVIVHTITIGSPGGGPVPAVIERGEVTEYVRFEGSIVISQSDAQLMRRIAEATGGRALTVDQAGVAASLVESVRGGGSAGDPESRFQPHDRFRWFAAVAFLLLSLDALASRSARRSRAIVQEV